MGLIAIALLVLVHTLRSPCVPFVSGAPLCDPATGRDFFLKKINLVVWVIKWIILNQEGFLVTDQDFMVQRTGVFVGSFFTCRLGLTNSETTIVKWSYSMSLDWIFRPRLKTWLNR